MDTSKQHTISFCSGYAGLDRGIELAGTPVRTIAYVEIEAFAIANLVAKMESGLLVPAPVWSNLKTFPLEKFRGKVHGITAGYPCQPFSCAGQRRGAEDPRHLWPHIKRAVSIIRPQWCFFENVEGHVTLGLSTVISDLEELGYIVEAGLFSAAEVGAPHRRKRIFILGYSRQFAKGNKSFGLDRWEDGDTQGIRTETRDRSSDTGSLGNTADVRLCGHCENPGATCKNESRKKCGLCESSGASSLSGHESQQEGLAYTESERCGETRGDYGRRKERTSEFCKTLADTNKPGSQGRNSGIMQERSSQWPSGPGSAQHDWEPPRVSEPQMGGMPHGSYSRVDELRLLGNGVVPQQAARAWITLNNRIRRNICQ